ncbi:MAG: aminoacetone oxidase family FAD-binding enzyme [Gemmatimonadales bacterium]
MERRPAPTGRPAGSRELTHPVVVVGAGAAGLLAALFAARNGRPVILLERTKDGGRKILIAGGGRCNILPMRVSPERFVTQSSPNSLRNILTSWPLDQQIAFFEAELGMGLVLEADSGKYFPATHRAKDVRDGLVHRVREAGVQLRFGTRVTDVTPGTNAWTVGLLGGEHIEAGAVILASGGLSVPSTGSDGTGLAIARALGHTVHDTYPALTPLTTSNAAHTGLAGISLDVTLTAPGTHPRFHASGGFLFTHRGYSGPSVLDASHLAVRSRLAGARQSLLVQWTDRDAEGWERELRQGKGHVATRLERAMPARLAHQLLYEAGLHADQTVAHLDRATRQRLVTTLTTYDLPWDGDEGYRKAEVTGGGVALSEVHPKTMESRRHPGLHLCGEMLDAFGPIGGHNFLWAWATGRAAGLGVS